MNTRLVAQTIAVWGALAALSCGDEKHDSAAPAGMLAQSAAGHASTSTAKDDTPAQSDPRCPEVKLTGVATLPSCCDPNGQCGINPAMFGTPGCLDLATAAQQAAGLGLDKAAYPPPRGCDAAPDAAK